MATLKERILTHLGDHPGRTDREITNHLVGKGDPQQPVNQACRQMVNTGFLQRRQRPDGLLGNYPTGRQYPTPSRPSDSASSVDDSQGMLQEDDVKRHLDSWLHDKGWKTQVAWGRTRGVDIVATKGRKRWLIEAKGCGSSQPMRVNYFLGVLGELLQRMDDPAARYSIAFPDMKQFRGLWERLPSHAKESTGITALFVRPNGSVRDES